MAFVGFDFHKKMDSHKNWGIVKLKEIAMLRSVIDEQWIRRIVIHNLQNAKANHVFKFLWKTYFDKLYITNVGYGIKIKKINREYIGKLLKQIREGRLKI